MFVAAEFVEVVDSLAASGSVAFATGVSMVADMAEAVRVARLPALTSKR